MFLRSESWTDSGTIEPTKGRSKVEKRETQIVAKKEVKERESQSPSLVSKTKMSPATMYDHMKAAPSQFCQRTMLGHRRDVRSTWERSLRDGTA